MSTKSKEKNPDNVKRGKAAKSKGKSGEREVSKLICEYGFEARRGVQFSGRGKGGEEAPDVISNIKNVHVEVKRTEALSVYKAMEQATDDAPEGHKPVVFHRRNNREWLVILKASDYLDLEVKAAI